MYVPTSAEGWALSVNYKYLAGASGEHYFDLESRLDSPNELDAYANHEIGWSIDNRKRTWIKNNENEEEVAEKYPSWINS